MVNVSVSVMMQAVRHWDCNNGAEYATIAVAASFEPFVVRSDSATRPEPSEKWAFQS